MIDTEQSDWMTVDAEMRACAANRGAFDYEEGCVFLRARETGAWRGLGFASLQEYIHARLGYDWHTANERIRVADALRRLTSWVEPLRTGEVCWSKIREASRIATEEIQGEWLEAMESMTTRELERLCGALLPGDLPTTPVNPQRIRRVLRVQTDADGWAALTQALDLVKSKVDPTMSDSKAFVAIATYAASMLSADKETPAAPFQVAMVQCPECRQMAAVARDESLPVPDDVRERVECDAEVVRTDTPTKPCRTVPAAVTRLVKARAQHRCEIPGCPNRNWLQQHHVRTRSDGGPHDHENLVLLCSAHHDAVHDGRIFPEGDRSRGLDWRHADGTPYGRATASARAVDVFQKAFAALRIRGRSERAARRILDRIRAEGGDLGLESVLRRAGIADIASERRSHVGLEGWTSDVATDYACASPRYASMTAGFARTSSGVPSAIFSP